MKKKSITQKSSECYIIIKNNELIFRNFSGFYREKNGFSPPTTSTVQVPSKRKLPDFACAGGEVSLENPTIKMYSFIKTKNNIFRVRVPSEFVKTVSRSPEPLGLMMPAAPTRGTPSSGAKGSSTSHIHQDEEEEGGGGHFHMTKILMKSYLFLYFTKSLSWSNFPFYTPPMGVLLQMFC